MIVVYQTWLGRGMCHLLHEDYTHLPMLVEPSECLWMVPNLVDPYR